MNKSEVKHLLTHFALSMLGAVFLLMGCVSAPTTPEPKGTDNEEPSAEQEAAASESEIYRVAVPPGGEPVVGDRLLHVVQGEPQTLNPITASDNSQSIINGPVYDSLLGRDLRSEGFPLIPHIAESWEVSEDKLTFTFKLREGVSFSDGKPLTAHDVKFTFDRIKDPTVKAPHVRLYYKDIESAELLDDYTIRFKASKLYFKHLEMLGGFEILPKHLWATSENFDEDPLGRAPVGSGRYQFIKWVTGDEVVLQRREDWWGEKYGLPQAYPKHIVYKFINEPQTALQALKIGRVDMFNHIPPVQWKRQLIGARVQKDLHKVQYMAPIYGYFGWNMRRDLFKDREVRKALTLLMDRQKIIEFVYEGLATPATGPFLEGDLSRNPDIKPTPFNPKEAMEILDKKGWIDSDDDGIRDQDGKAFEFSVMIPNGSKHGEKISLIYKQELARAGIKLNLVKREWASMLELLDERNFDAVVMAWVLGIDGDPYQIWHSSQAELKRSSNHIGYINSEADKLIEAGRVEFDPEKRAALYRRLHQILIDDYPQIFIVVRPGLMAVQKRWTNIEIYGPRPNYEEEEWFVPLADQRVP